ncbi:MAG: RagB/SusD family nutrient uptake outer membrane protein [Muribaculaceae bacterium]|nr:RagB/SusD family nutrient uptake outer membrane protein [Muribaculaceae bacterium]
MKKSYKFLALAMIFGATSAMTSCSDYLDKQPSNELTEDKTLGSWSMFEYFHNDTYNFLLHGANRVNGSWLDAATDLSQTSFATGGTRTTFNIGNYYGGGGSAELSDTWESRYRGIRKCNRVINQMDQVPNDITKTPEQEARDRDIMRAEARTFRAYFYWELFLRFGPLPIVTEVLDPTQDMITPYSERPTVKEYVVDFILRELEEAESDLLSYEDAWSANRIGRLSKPMNRALVSRIKLYMASPRYAAQSGITWQEAAEAAESFIRDFGGNFGLFAEANIDPAENYANAVLRTQYTGNNNEVIFFRNDVTIGWTGISLDTPVGEGGSGGNCPSQNLVDMYDMADGSSPFMQYDATGAPVYPSGSLTPAVNSASGYSDAAMWDNRDPRLRATVLYQGVQWGTTRDNSTIDVRPGMADNPTGNANATPTGYYMRKYIPASILSSNHSGTAYRLWTIIRYAEILMNYAEAMNELNGPCQQVFDMLDMVRHRAGITGSVADRADLADKDAMRNFIHKERTVEFAFEEHRSWDVRRWNVAVEALSRPVYGVNVAMDGTISRKKAQDRVFEERMYLYPIPEGEVWKTGLENNPGW